MKLVILGAAGMLGHQIWLKSLEKFGPQNTFGTLRKPKSHYDRFGIFKTGQILDNLDVTDFEQTQKALETIRPDVVINCIGLTLRKPDLADLEKCIDINSMLPHRLVLWGAKNSARVIHFSTDCVFNGKRGNYSETDIPTAEDLYGKSKFLGEIQGKNALTLRLSIVGRELEGKTELVEWFLSQKDQSVKGFSSVRYSGITTNVVAKEVIKIITDYPDLAGVYQLASEPITKFEILELLNDKFNVGAQIQESGEYTSDKTLDSSRFTEATGFVPPKWSSMIAELAQASDAKYESRP
ncbi:MAG: SDR family oxidoreductase [Proteobacteria bacterium]|nr:MAG: SDR family oxidoreductase [Pseudomonadota bacterium]